MTRMRYTMSARSQGKLHRQRAIVEATGLSPREHLVRVAVLLGRLEIRKTIDERSDR